MKQITLFILAVVLFVGLTFAGKSFFGMEEGMHMDSVECVNHCLSTSVFPAATSNALPIVLFVLVFFAREILRSAQDDTKNRFNFSQYTRLTEPIRFSRRTHQLSPVMIRD